MNSNSFIRIENQIFPKSSIYNLIFNDISRKFNSLIPMGPRLGNKKVVVCYSNSSSSPYAKYNSSNDKFYEIFLNTKEGYWAQFVYQFSHELMHIYISTIKEESNNWLIESICELSSHYFLNYLSNYYRIYLRDLRLYNYSLNFKSYSIDIVEQKILNCLWLNESFPDDSFMIRMTHLKQEYDREFNLLVALKLYPYFKNSFKFWSIIPYLKKSSDGSAIPNFDQMINSFEGTELKNIAIVLKTIIFQRNLLSTLKSKNLNIKIEQGSV